MNVDVNEAFYSYDNFILGSTLPATLFVQSTCCQSLVPVTIQDLANNKRMCQLEAKEEESELSEPVLLSTGGIVAVIVIVVLLMLIGIAIGVIFYIKHKRSVDLQEMRRTPF